MKKKASKRKRNPHSPNSRENQAAYLNAYLQDIASFSRQNFGRLESLSSEKLADLISKVKNFEDWMIYYLELRKI